MSNSAILLAAGFSTRIGLERPKQYIEIDGQSILEICLNKFLTHPRIHNILVVVNRDHHQYFTPIINKISSEKLIGVIEGGETRALSVLNGLRFLQNYLTENVLIHDVARPFCSSNLIDNLLNALESYIGVIPVVKAVDTIKKFQDIRIVDTIDRDQIGYAQTPQGFKWEVISQLHFDNKDYHITDDAVLLERSGIPIHTIFGEQDNKKVTYMEDLENLTKKKIKIGQGFDVHAFKAAEKEVNNCIMLGGVAIPHEKSLEAHSDGDVVLHALCDALLGALGEGDIGEHFPPSDNKWKGASSLVFVEHIMEILNQRKGKVVNVDITILAEAPKINPYKKDLRQVIAKSLNIPESDVNIKATTTEKLGFVGRKEGIACFANLLVEFY